MTSDEAFAQKKETLLQLIRSFGSCAVAFSGGVDSAVVAKAAQLALGDRAVAVTGASASLAQGELDGAIQVAEQIGIRHEIISTNEFESPEYLRNAPDRCFHCKTELYSRLEELIAVKHIGVIINGANADDAGDYRPGMKAALNHRVRSPLLECGFNKQDVRALAAHWQLAVWDKPASPCLSSRVAYGEEVTPGRLKMIDQAETYLREQGFRTLRVRYHRGDLARIEVPVEDLARFAEPTFRDTVNAYFQELGFKYVTLDLLGFRSGSQNAVLTPESKLVSLQAVGSVAPPSVAKATS